MNIIIEIGMMWTGALIYFMAAAFTYRLFPSHTKCWHEEECYVAAAFWPITAIGYLILRPLIYIPFKAAMKAVSGES